MGKGNGGTRNIGASTGGIVPAQANNDAWRKAEGSENYSYSPDKVKFSTETMDMVESPLTPAELRYKADYEFVGVERDMTDGKYHINEGNYIYNEPRTFSQAVKEAVTFSKERYQNNERMRDRMIKVQTDDDNAPTAWVTAELVGDNKVRIRISRFKPYNA